jgi:hypothetical protein
MAFAVGEPARLPLFPTSRRARVTTLIRASLASQTARMSRPASHPASRPRTGASLPGTQASPRTGLTPAGRPELVAPTSCGPPFLIAPEQSRRTRQFRDSCATARSRRGATANGLLGPSTCRRGSHVSHGSRQPKAIVDEMCACRAAGPSQPRPARPGPAQDWSGRTGESPIATSGTSPNPRSASESTRRRTTHRSAKATRGQSPEVFSTRREDILPRSALRLGGANPFASSSDCRRQVASASRRLARTFALRSAVGGTRPRRAVAARVVVA